MEEFKGTRGNWSYSKGSGNIRGEGGILAELPINGSEDHNGTLMAAALELLEELIETHSALCFTPDYLGSLRYEKNKAAISKALGKE
ncbi:hypothetical protein [Citrobacter sp. Cf042]|uniref:hypothetical protein n=1 Tax=Citrobacter sp. Cf042 TaxID=2985045 RepID=UPI002581CBDF|nr:hypothetical protein [Citrobacter sp. Cf042]MDM3283539.1 hypothetical protein [Citrobacter sp. Cf042]HEC5315894.1 hypothetical protein [Citrobacter freundii]